MNARRLNPSSIPEANFFKLKDVTLYIIIRLVLFTTPSIPRPYVLGCAADISSSQCPTLTGLTPGYTWLINETVGRETQRLVVRPMRTFQDCFLFWKLLTEDLYSVLTFPACSTWAALSIKKVPYFPHTSCSPYQFMFHFFNFFRSFVLHDNPFFFLSPPPEYVPNRLWVGKKVQSRKKEKKTTRNGGSTEKEDRFFPPTSGSTLWRWRRRWQTWSENTQAQKVVIGATNHGDMEKSFASSNETA